MEGTIQGAAGSLSSGLLNPMASLKLTAVIVYLSTNSFDCSFECDLTAKRSLNIVVGRGCYGCVRLPLGSTRRRKPV